VPQHVQADFVGAAAHTEEVRGAIYQVEAAASAEGQRVKINRCGFIRLRQRGGVQAKVGIVGDAALGGDLGNDSAKIMVEKLNHVDGVVGVPQHVKADFVRAAAHTEEGCGAIDQVEAAASSEPLERAPRKAVRQPADRPIKSRSAQGPTNEISHWHFPSFSWS
jgi:hypothetical protein